MLNHYLKLGRGELATPNERPPLGVSVAVLGLGFFLWAWCALAFWPRRSPWS